MRRISFCVNLNMFETLFILITLAFIVLLGLLALVVYLRSTVSFKSDESMKGRVAIVTGANAGIGLHTAKGLAKRGARVILACRNEERGISARDAIISATGNREVVFKQLDLSSLLSVRKFAAHILETEKQLHVLINNAGVYGLSNRTEDGIVESMQVNYFGHFLLTLLLLPLLKKSRSSRIINLSSILHWFGSFNPDKVNNGALQSWQNYCDSKFLMVMFTVELSLRLKGTGVVANAVHPGVILTGITSPGSSLARLLFWCWCQLYNRTAEQGAQTVEYLAVSKDCANVSGEYFVDCAKRFMLWTARNETVAKQLWEFSRELVGLK